jgi:y4mF family transcriptional regulator
MENIGRSIQQLRKKTGLTQPEFAKRVGVGLRFVRELEQGKTSVRMDKVNQVLKFLGHHMEIVFDHERKNI